MSKSRVTLGIANRNLMFSQDITRRIVRRTRHKRMSQEAGRRAHQTWHLYSKRPSSAMGAAIESELQYVATLRRMGMLNIARALLKSVRAMQKSRLHFIQIQS